MLTSVGKLTVISNRMLPQCSMEALAVQAMATSSRIGDNDDTATCPP